MPDPAPNQRGLESVGRIAAILRTLAAGQGNGVRLSDLAQSVGLSRGTTHRLLAALAVERLVKRPPGTRLYQLGEDVPLLGWSATVQSTDIRELCSPVVQRLAESTGDTAYFAVRFGFESVCLERRFGAFPIKVLTIDVGSRRPLGVGAGALALLAALPDREIAQVVPAIIGRLAAFPGYAPEVLPRLVAQTRARGYSLSEGQIAEGVSGVGVAVRGKFGEPTCALSVAAISSRMAGPGLERAAAALLAQRDVLERAIRGEEPGKDNWRRGARQYASDATATTRP